MTMTRRYHESVDTPVPNRSDTDMPVPKRKKRKSYSEKHHEQAESSQKRTKLLQDYMENKARRREERHREIMQALANNS